MPTISYQSLAGNAVQKLIDGQPADALFVEDVATPEAARDPRWAEFMRWLAAGNTLLAAPPPSVLIGQREAAVAALRAMNFSSERADIDGFTAVNLLNPLRLPRTLKRLWRAVQLLAVVAALSEEADPGN